MRMPVQNSPLGGIAQRMNDTMLKFFLSQPTGMERDYMQAGTDLRSASLETERMKAAAAQQTSDAQRKFQEAFRGTRKSTRLNSSNYCDSRMLTSARHKKIQ